MMWCLTLACSHQRGLGLRSLALLGLAPAMVREVDSAQVQSSSLNQALAQTWFSMECSTTPFQSTSQPSVAR